MKRYSILTLFAGLLAFASVVGQDNRNPVVEMDTSFGKIKIELFADKAPITTKNFLDYVEAKFYDGTIFHRVIPTFMIQGGGMEPGLKEKKTRDPIKNEAGNGLSNKRGAIAMARTNELDSATAQFFINVVDNTRLDQLKYAVFGQVISGMEAVDMIRGVQTGSRGGHDDVPVQDVLIRSVRRVK